MKNFWSRRDFLFKSGGGISGLALAYLLDQEGLLGAETDIQGAGISDSRTCLLHCIAGSSASTGREPASIS